MTLHASSLRLRRTLFSLVLLAFALAQTLGLVHRIVHSPLAMHVAAGVPAAQASGDWLKALFAGHSTEQGCELYDQLSHSDLMQIHAVVVPLLHPTEARAPVHPVWQIAAQAIGFLARGPPQTS